MIHIEYFHQAAEVLRRQSNIRESDISTESAMKLRNAEARLTELKAIVLALGREASAAMLSVETQQQQMTYQRLFAMVYKLIFSCVRLCMCWHSASYLRAIANFLYNHNDFCCLVIISCMSNKR